MNINNILTIKEIEELSTLLIPKQVVPEEMPLEAPVSRYKPKVERGGRVMPGELLIMEQRGLCKLSEGTRRRELARIKQRQEYLANRGKKVRRKRGKFHHRSKEATRRRYLEKFWRRDPFGCILYRDRRACKNIDKAKWNEHIAPLWEKYDPKELSITFPAKSGTKKDPWTLYNMTVTRTWKERGKERKEVVFYGNDLLLWDLSGGEGVS